MRLFGSSFKSPKEKISPIKIPKIAYAHIKGERMKNIVLADHRVPGGHHVSEQPRARVDAEARSDNRVRSDLHVVRELRARVDDRCGVDASASARPRGGWGARGRRHRRAASTASGWRLPARERAEGAGGRGPLSLAGTTLPGRSAARR